MLDHTLDSFDGITLELEKFRGTDDQLLTELCAVIALSRINLKRLIWVTLQGSLTRFISVFLDYGFIFHNCQGSTAVLVLKLQDSAYIPFSPTHTIGVGGFVLSEGELLCVKGHSASSNLKLPGGTVDRGEKIVDEVIREVYEETGITCKFSSVLGFATKSPVQFGYTDMYFVCELLALDRDISVKDTVEIKQAQWIDIDCYLNGDHSSPFNQQVVQMSLKKLGLAPVNQESYADPIAKQEIFWASA
ncbi:NUDIX domain-containing protein [Microbulbifer sp. OS29]|uniref:NUDIX domain-containing protein n=1 Tax=Microbulbifer okhotskensis TaxID=2926617 RepID=A0A9X2ERM5_9GAMM|nr:NUDIX domain-containing protein [Microbulbifer okhotskensis]MCO1334463.1 NUDIX domain-containing protein [Microbulbifer okhotskensis]